VVPPLCVAFSGGADSTALLLAAAQRWPGAVSALHVNHGIQVVAGDFEQHCQLFCEQWRVPLVVRRIDARHTSGQSPEDAARQGRYAALAHMASQLECPRVLLAQHADDQVETLLLALSRGAGLPGLASMPVGFVRDGVSFCRPLLGLSSDAIRQWLAINGISYAQDPSNADIGLTRNRIRLKVIPAIAAAFGQYRETFGRSAAHAAQAQELLEELAQIDLSRAGSPPAIAALQALSPARQTNALRFWLKASHSTAPSTAQLAELLAQIRACKTRGHHIHLRVGSGFVQRTGEHLDWYTPTLF
jgi:tRNA(Ile)-lysidine synthase